MTTILTVGATFQFPDAPFKGGGINVQGKGAYQITLLVEQGILGCLGTGETGAAVCRGLAPDHDIRSPAELSLWGG